MNISRKAINETKSFIDRIFSNSKNFELPVNINQIIKEEGVELVNYTFDEDISGVLVLNGSQSTIGVNQSHSEVRKRFTMAHELGHYILHRDQGSSMFMDKVLYRKASNNYSPKDGKMEREANFFAANLLMPEAAIHSFIDRNHIDFYEDSDIQDMATEFGVSSSAMTYRLINLGLVDYR